MCTAWYRHLPSLPCFSVQEREQRRHLQVTMQPISPSSHPLNYLFTMTNVSMMATFKRQDRNTDKTFIIFASCLQWSFTHLKFSWDACTERMNNNNEE